MKRLALVGFGSWGSNYLKTINAMDGVEVSFICRRDIDKTPDSIRNHIECVSDYKDVFDVDGVIIATPPDSHKEISLFFLERGIPVILEKPVSETYEDASFIMDASFSLNVPVLVDNIHLFSSYFLYLRNITKRWGRVYINSIGGGRGPFRGYSPLIDWGPHDMSMILSIFQSYPDEIEIKEFKSMGGFIYDIKLKFGESTTHSVVGNGMSEKRRSFSAFDGDINVEYNGGLLIDGKLQDIPKSDPLKELISTFLSYLNHGITDWRFNPSLNRDVMKILSNG